MRNGRQPDDLDLKEQFAAFDDPPTRAASATGEQRRAFDTMAEKIGTDDPVDGAPRDPAPARSLGMYPPMLAAIVVLLVLALALALLTNL